MTWPWVSRREMQERLADAQQQIRALTERNDRLIEAVSRHSDGKLEVMMPREAQPLEISTGWFDNKPVGSMMKETKQ